MTLKKIFFCSLFTSILLIFLTDPATYYIHKGILNSLESSILEPLFFFVSSLTLSSIILLFFNNQIFKLWLNKFMIWFVPISLVLIAMGSVEVNYGWPTRTSMAIGMGVVMVVTTLVFALVQRFYFKVR